MSRSSAPHVAAAFNASGGSPASAERASGVEVPPGAPQPAPEFNSSRVIVAVLKEICAARGIELTGFSNDWLFHLRHGGRATYVFGYDFGLNSATAKIICKDKSATSDLLAFHGLPHVEHHIFHGPQLTGYVPLQGNWQPMLEYFERCGRDVVCKPNEGSGGRGVLRARTPAELEAAVVHIFERNRSLCLSPFETILGGEIRVTVLRGEVQFAYRKDRPALVGDGRSTVRELVLARLQSSTSFAGDVAGLAQAVKTESDYARVPVVGEEVLLNWRHNLAQGSVPMILDTRDPATQTICVLAQRAVKALEVQVASVDIVVTPAGPKILEVNSGIMMESLARHHPDGRAMAYRFYDRIVCASLGIDAAVAQ